MRQALLALALAVLVTSYVGVMVLAGSLWPWLEVVHEDGIRTLLGTVFYFEHAARELPMDLFLAVGLAAATRGFFAPALTQPRETARSGPYLLAATSIAILIAIIVGALITVGGPALLDNLMQMHTRSGAALVPGGHWRYHLLERLSLGFGVFAAAGLVSAVTGCTRPHRNPAAWLAALIGAYAAASFSFGITIEPFRDPQYLGHQARELLTHGLVTVPLGLYACLRQIDCDGTPMGMDTPLSGLLWAAGALSIGLGVYVGIASLATGARDYGQTQSLAGLLFPHVFEHAFTYVLVPVLAAALVGLSAATVSERAVIQSR